ncbi:tetratricopeptide repeat protein [Streptomyces sp. CA-135486]|uniref:tetratricopeptide repeat protein n=1 Tax=Streptomyces sp. CA-135486 TaxID=3240049 RepID=UPI003D8FDCE5
MTERAAKEPGQIITFYSYKGGVGRSFALANTAALLAQWGYRVLCVDWDLEAPGLTYFFESHMDRPTAGLLEMVEGIRPGARMPPDALKNRTKVELPNGARLDLIASGKADETYISRLQRIDWERLYDECDFGRVLESWREQWMKEYDLILVDSRTGITDAGGICTAQVPDVLVFAFTANQQNIDGVLDIVQRSMAARDDLPYDRPRLLTIPLLSRFDAQTEYELGEMWRRKLAKNKILKKRLRDWIPKGTPIDEMLQRLTIPYFPIWSFGESLPVITETHSYPDQVSYSIATLAALLARRLHDVRLFLENRDSYVATAVQGAKRDYASDVFLSYSSTTAELARRLIPMLSERQITTYPKSVGEVGQHRYPQSEFIDASHHFVLLADESLDTEQRQDLQYFLRQSVNSATERRTLPVVVSAQALRALPPVVRNIQSFNLARADLADAADHIAAQVNDTTGEFEFGAARSTPVAHYDVFVSYTYADREWAVALAENLHLLGLDVWLDQVEAVGGQRLLSRLMDGSARADAVVVVVSPHSAASGWANDELAAAVTTTDRVIPVLLGDVDLPPFITSRLFFDFRRVASLSEYTHLVRQLARAVSGRPANTNVALSAPPAVTGSVHAVLRINADSVVLATPTTETSFTPLSVDHELEQLLWALSRERVRAGHPVVTRDVHPRLLPTLGDGMPKALAAVGAALGERFAGGEVAVALRDEIRAAQERNAKLRLGLQVDESRWQNLPWETLVVPGTDEPLALSSALEMYHVTGRQDSSLVPLVPGPLRVLAVVANPSVDAAELLDSERELARILDAVDRSRTGHGAYVRVLNWGTLADIRAALEEERFHVLHLSCHAGPGTLTLEDEAGRPHEVDAQQFAETLPPGRGVPLMVLAACSTARVPKRWDEPDASDGSRTRPEQSATSVAWGLISRGVPAVLAMTDIVSDAYATELTSLLYEELARAERPDPLSALSRARRSLETVRQRLPVGDPRAAFPEWPVPALFLAGKPLPLFEHGYETSEEILFREPVLDEGMVVHKVGDFVGRRTELRRLRAALRDPGRAGVLVHGIGGVGKSTLAAELLHHLGADAGLVVSVPAATTRTVDAFLETLRQRLTAYCLAEDLSENDQLRRVAVALTDARSPWRDRWELIRQLVLPRLTVLLILDNAEDLLTRSGDGRQLSDPALADLLAAWTAASPRTRLLITSRYPFSLPQRAHKRLTTHHLGPLSLAETRKLIWRLPGLDALGPADQHRAYTDVGGHPRALEYLDALLRGGPARFPDIADRMETALERRGINDPERWLAGVRGDLDTALAETVTLAVDDILLDTLLDQLTEVPEARRLLEGLAVYRTPVDRIGAAWQLSEFAAPPEPDPALVQRIHAVNLQISEARTAGAEAAEGYGLSPETIAQYQRDWEGRQRPPVELDDHAENALKLLLELGLVSPALAPQDDSGTLPSGLVVHPWTAGALHQRTHPGSLAGAHNRAAAYWRWRVDVWPQDRVSDITQLIEARYHHHQADDIDQADIVTRHVCSQLHTWGAWDWEQRLLEETLTWVPARSRPAAAYIHQLGLIAQLRGEYGQAEEHYRAALSISEELGDRSGIAGVYHQLGMIAQLRGEYGQAEEHYRAALSISEELGDRSGIAGVYHQLGMIAQDRGMYGEAEEHYRAALSISEELGDRSGLAGGYHQLGLIAQLRGEYGEAEEHYRAALSISEELGDRSGLAGGYHQLGLIAQLRGEYGQAEEHYRAALSISEELGDRSGLAGGYHQLGRIAQERGDFQQAEEHYRRALAIKEELGNRSGLATSYHQLGVIAQERGDFQQAEEHYRRALAIKEELGNRSGLATSYHQLGVIAQERGDFQQAEEHYRRALAIKEELGDRSGIAGVYHQLGLIAQERGEYGDAEERYRASLSISEELGDRSGLATSYGQLGALRTVQHRPDEGVPYTLQALAICMEIGVAPYTFLYWLAQQRALIGDDAFGALIGDLLPDDMAAAVMNTTPPQAEPSSDEASIDQDGPTNTVQA